MRNPYEGGPAECSDARGRLGRQTADVSCELTQPINVSVTNHVRFELGRFSRSFKGAVKCSVKQIDWGGVNAMNAKFKTLCGMLLLAVGCDTHAQGIATGGCPLFHCTVEATSVTYQPMIGSPSRRNDNSTLGDIQKQGCSGNGTTLACLFQTDTAPSSFLGTLKVLDATTLQPIWGSAGSSYDLNAPSASDGQVPVNFSDGSIAAGDAYYLVHYSATGTVLQKVPLLGLTVNYGITPISATYGIVSQANGVLTLINWSNWSNWTSVNTLQLKDPATGALLQLVSPSSGTANVLYAVGFNKVNKHGFLFSIGINPSNKLAVNSVFTFTGQTGASPVVVTGVSGLPTDLILLHVPGLIGDATPQNRLLGLTEAAPVFTQTWAIPLTAPLLASPTVDQGSGSLFYHQNYNPIIYQNKLATGARVRSFNLQTISGLSVPLALNTHLGAIQANSVFTLLLGASYTAAPGVGAQYVLAFQPIASPTTLSWSWQISSVPAHYLAAWNFAPSSQAGIVCPIAISVPVSGASDIVRLCDF